MLHVSGESCALRAITVSRRQIQVTRFIIRGRRSYAIPAQRAVVSGRFSNFHSDGARELSDCLHEPCLLSSSPCAVSPLSPSPEVSRLKYLPASVTRFSWTAPTVALSIPVSVPSKMMLTGRHCCHISRASRPTLPTMPSNVIRPARLVRLTVHRSSNPDFLPQLTTVLHVPSQTACAGVTTLTFASTLVILTLDSISALIHQKTKRSYFEALWNVHRSSPKASLKMLRCQKRETSPDTSTENRSCTTLQATLHTKPPAWSPSISISLRPKTILSAGVYTLSWRE